MEIYVENKVLIDLKKNNKKTWETLYRAHKSSFYSCLDEVN
jgi:hypothetical protein